MLYFFTVCLLEYRGFQKRRKEYRELEHFAEFLANLNYEFYVCKSVTESIFRAAEYMPGNLRRKLEEICFLLEGEDAETAVAEYRYPLHLKYLKLFFIQCQNAVQYGSGKPGTESVFVKNMTELRRDVQNECYKRSQAAFLFAGLGLVAAVPVVFVPLVRKFGTVNMPELKNFYEGAAGRLIVIAVSIVTVCSYALLTIVRKTNSTFYRRPRFLCAAAAGGLSFCTAWVMRGEGIGRITAAVLVSAVLGAGMVLLFYRYAGYLRKIGMGGEVLGLQSVIFMLYDVPNMTVMKLLSALEDYAELFQKTLIACADRYAAEESEALELLRGEETYPAFRQLAGRIAISERIGLLRAFSGIAADRQFFREQQRLDTEQELKKKAANAQILAFVPMALLLFFYLILPFLFASIGQMSEIFKEMEQIRYFQ